MKAIKSSLFATASVGALFTVLAMAPAMATPIYDINPNAIPGISGKPSSVEITNAILASDSTIVQTTASSQTDTGFAYVTAFQDNGSPVTQSGLNAYGVFIRYTAVVNGLTGFTAGQNGTIAPGGFNYTLSADVGFDDTYTPGSTGVVGTPPTVDGAGSANDVVLAQGSSLSGSAGFQASTGAPTFATVSSFIICNGTPGFGTLMGQVVAAANCGSYNALNYFIKPVPFYNLQLASFTASDASDLQTSGTTGIGSNATLNGIGGSASFAQVPEPLTLSLFGAGLLGMGGLRRFRSKKA